MTDARTITLTLGGEWRGSYGTAPCPVCQPERRADQRALSLRSDGGRLLTFCHKTGCDFRAITQAAGLPATGGAIDLQAAREADEKRAAYEAEQRTKARRLWDAGKPICGTKGEAYLRGRGITCDLPWSLRWVGAVHAATMMMARRLNHVETIPQQDAAERALNKLARTFATQLETLKRYRTGGQQKVTVEHVTVNAGGQAIVGAVSHGGGGQE